MSVSGLSVFSLRAALNLAYFAHLTLLAVACRGLISPVNNLKATAAADAASTHEITNELHEVLVHSKQGGSKS